MLAAFSITPQKARLCNQRKAFNTFYKAKKRRKSFKLDLRLLATHYRYYTTKFRKLQMDFLPKNPL